MPIGEQVTIASHTGNGVATVFAYSFGVLAADDLKVLVNGVEVTTGFTVSGIGSRSGGTVTFSTAPTSGAAILIVREVVRKRDTDYQYGGDLREEVLDDDFDRIWMTLQEDGELVDRGVRVPVGETLAELPAAASRVNKVLTFGAGGAVALVDVSAFSGGGVVELIPADGSLDLVKFTTAVQNLINGALQKSGGTMTGALTLAGDAAGALGAVTKQQLDAVVPPGAVQAFAMSTAPPGWLKANGAAISRTTYAALFAAIGTTFGAGDGSTTFNLPDLRGEFVRGWDDGRGVDSGRVFGAGQSGQMPEHSHNQIGGATGGSFGGASAGWVSNMSATAPTDRAVSSTGGTENSSENRPRNVALLYCIKF